MIRKKRHKHKFKVRIIANGRIRASQVRVIDEEKGSLGIMPTGQAIRKAYDQDKDLVLINEKQDPPIAKIIELSKYKYQLKQKASASRKKAKAQAVKEVRFTPFMSDGDFEAREKKVKQFLEDGKKVKLSLAFKGRQITKKEFGEEIFAKIIENTRDIAAVEIEPKMIGKKLVAQLMPRK